jgi:lipopolysaccharide export system permease protein
MPLLQRYLLREFAGTTAATLLILMMISLGGVLTDLLRDIARGQLPAALMLSQLGLRVVGFLPLVLPLSLFLGLLMAIGRLYRDSEMAVLASVGLGAQELWRAVAGIALPVVGLIAFCSLWAGPAADRRAIEMIDSANRSLLVAGLDAGRFVELPGGQGVIYVGEMAADGTRFGRLFLQRTEDGRIDVTTARTGRLFFDGAEERFLALEDGFRVEGPLGGREWRLMRFERNEVQLPDRARTQSLADPARADTGALLASDEPAAAAELHWRLATPLFAIVLAVLAIPLARSEPRQARYGRMILAFLAYLLYVNLLFIGRAWLGDGTLPGWAGLWWLHGPAAALALWLFARDGRLARPRAARRRALAPVGGAA